MAEKISQPVWTIFRSSKDVKFQEYDIFPKEETPRGGGRTNTSSIAPRSHLPVVKPESQVIKPSLLDHNKGISLSPRARSGPSVVNSEDRTSPRATGSFKVKEESVSPGTRAKVHLSGSEKAHPCPSQCVPRKDNTNGQLKRNKDVGEIMQFPEAFQPSTSTSIFEKPEEAAAAALNYFEKRRLQSGRKFNFPISDYQTTLKKYYPNFINNAQHGIVGHVPGVEVGLTLRYRDELRLLGIHREKQKGIDSKDVLKKDGYNRERVALSVVLSGRYEDCSDHGEVLIYVGEGGRDEKSNRQVKDQTMKTLGNQALKNNCHHKIPVRVIRKRMDSNSSSKRLYSYDGLYMVDEWEYVTGVAGFQVYRFMLVRERNQNALVWRKTEPKPFVGHATCQDGTLHGEMKPFVGQSERAAQLKAIARGKMKLSGDSIACRVATAGGKQPVIVKVASRKATVGGKMVLKEIVRKGKKISNTSKEDELNFINISDEESMPSASGEREEKSFIDISDEESMSSKVNDENFTGGLEKMLDNILSKESEEEPLRIPYEGDDFMVVDGEEGNGCIVHKDFNQVMLEGQEVSPRSLEEGGASSMLERKLSLDIQKVIVTNCHEVKDESASELENWKKNVEDEKAKAHGKDNQVEGKVQRDVTLQTLSQKNEEKEKLCDAEERDHKVNTSPTGKLEHYKTKKRIFIEEIIVDMIDDGGAHSTDEKVASKDDNESKGEKIVDKSSIGKPKQVYDFARWQKYEEKNNTRESLGRLIYSRKFVDKFNSKKKSKIM